MSKTKDKAIVECAERLQLFADSTRLQLVCRLLLGPGTVLELCQDIDSKMVTVSHHLQLLRKAGIVDCERQGQRVMYSMSSDVFSGDAKYKAAGRIDLGYCSLELGTTSVRRK